MSWTAIALCGYAAIGLLMVVAFTWSHRCASWCEARAFALTALCWPAIVLGALLTAADDADS